MKNNDNSRRSDIKQSLLTLFVVAFIIFALVNVFLKFYNAYINKILYAERLNQMKEVTTQLFSRLEDIVKSRWNSTEVQSNYLINYNPGTVDDLLDYMDRQDRLNGLSDRQMSLIAVDNNGTYYTQEGRNGILTEQRYLIDKPDKISFVSTSLFTDISRMVFLKRLERPIILQDGKKQVEICYYGISQNMTELNPYFDCSAYDGNNKVYVVDDEGLKLFGSNGVDILKGYNVYSVLDNLDYLHGSNFVDTKEKMIKNQIAYSNALLKDGEEIYYALYHMENSEWTLVFLVPSDYVATNTVRLVHITIRLIMIFAIILLSICALAIYFMLKRQQKTKVATERKNRETLEKLNIELEAANEAKSAFLANMSHDIRTPMNAIVGITDIMSHEDGVSDKMRGYIQKVQYSERHLMSLLNDILDMSKIESNAVEINDEHVNIDEQIGQLDSIIRPQANEKSQTFNIYTHNIKNKYLICDAVRMRQVFLNLLSNAIKYTQNGGEISFSVEEKESGKADYAKFKIVVTDNGYGMTKEFMEHIYEPFTRAENSTTNKVQGTGLGMAITKNILELMNGTIDVESEPGKGSRFEVNINLKIDKKAENNKGTIESSEISSEENNVNALEGKRFLCAEDNELNAEILRIMLERYGVECTIYKNGEEIVNAFENVKEGEYDAILMDLQMPGMNGIDATRKIRNGGNPLGKTIPIVAMTANVFSEDVKACLDAGMNAHISKPIDIVLMVKILRDLTKDNEKLHSK